MKPTASMTIDTSKFEPASDMETNFNKLLQVLYGTPADGQTAAKPGYLPTPDEVIHILTTGTETT